MTVHTVARGENLTQIARKHGIRNWRNLYFADGNQEFENKRKNPNLIRPGDKISIPSSDYLHPVESIPRRLYRDFPILRAQTTSHTCWRASAFMLWARKNKFLKKDIAFSAFEDRIGQFSKLPNGLGEKHFRPLFVGKLQFQEYKIPCLTDLNRVIAVFGPVLLTLIGVGPGGADHAVIVAGYDVNRGRLTFIDPAMGGLIGAVLGPSIKCPRLSFMPGESSWANLVRTIRFEEIPPFLELIYTA
ncbi:MAG: papain-like cysteine protease family protein [Pseudomonadota bacterium]